MITLIMLVIIIRCRRPSATTCSELRIDSRKENSFKTWFQIMSAYSAEHNNKVASCKTEVFLASSMYS